MDLSKLVARVIALTLATGAASCGGGSQQGQTPPPSVEIGYVPNAASNNVTSFLLDVNSAALNHGNDVSSGNLPGFAAVTPDHRVLFVSNERDGTISRYLLDGLG